MRYIKLILLLIPVLSSGILAQDFKGIDKVYGYDPLLYNGRYYTFHVPFGTSGHQYLTGQDYSQGSVTLRGNNYRGLMINYDIFNQQVILNYSTPEGHVNYIVLSDALLESFESGARQFAIISLPDSSKKIFQVLGKGYVRILYHWKKDLELNTFYGSKNYEFKQTREMILYTDGRFRTYHNNVSFRKLFNKDKRGVIKIYLRRNGINIKKADDRKITDLADYCSTL